MKSERIAFRDVRPGDRVHNNLFFGPDKWQEVTTVTNNGSIVSLFLGVTAHETIDTRSQIVGHPREGINVKRSDSNDE